MVIVLFSKGCEKVVYTCHYGGLFIDKAFDIARELLVKHKDAMYYEVFSDKEYETRFE